MTRYLTILGLTLVAAAALFSLANPLAGAVEEETYPIYFSASLGSEETGKIDGNQINTNTMTIGANPPVTCESIEYNGEAVTPGAVSERVRITPKYNTCHVIHFLLGTRTVTVAMNGCAYEVAANDTVTESEAKHFVGVTNITCPAGKEIEVLVYNTSNPNHTGASTLCTFKIGPQSNLTGTTLTNKENDVVADFSIESIKATSSGLCTGETASYKGEATLKVTNAKGEFVQAQVDRKKKLVFGVDKPVAKGEKGEAELVTEKVTVNCTSVEYKAEPGVQNTTELSYKPTYANCTAFEGKNDVQVKFEACEYKIKFNKDIVFPVKLKGETPSSFQVVCGMGESIKVTVTKEKDKVNAECSIVIPGQAAVDTVHQKNYYKIDSGFKADSIKLVHNVAKLNYEPKSNPATCGKNELLKDGKLLKEINVKGLDAKGNEVGVVIVGTEAP